MQFTVSNDEDGTSIDKRRIFQSFPHVCSSLLERVVSQLPLHCRKLNIILLALFMVVEVCNCVNGAT
jgi:hypothetical protein